jgi:hypothetical protein
LSASLGIEGNGHCSKFAVVARRYCDSCAWPVRRLIGS